VGTETLGVTRMNQTQPLQITSDTDTRRFQKIIFIVALLLFAIATILALLDRNVGLISTVYGAATLCLLFAFLSYFKHFEMFGLKAELNEVKEIQSAQAEDIDLVQLVSFAGIVSKHEIKHLYGLAAKEGSYDVRYSQDLKNELKRLDDFGFTFPNEGMGLNTIDERFGADIRLGEVLKIHHEGIWKRLETTDGDMYAKTVLLATGSDYKKLGIPGEKEYFARGVHYCATCDGAFYRDKRLIVVGGGNSAVQEAIFLTRFATNIDLLVRGDHLRASEILQHDLEKHKDKILVHLNTTTDEIIGKDGKVVAVIGTDKHKKSKVRFETDGVFIFIGLMPNTDFLKDTTVDLDEIGMIKTDDYLETSMEGVFAAGDVRSGATMQIASATGEGATAALMIRKHLEQLERVQIGG